MITIPLILVIVMEIKIRLCIPSYQLITCLMPPVTSSLTVVHTKMSVCNEPIVNHSVNALSVTSAQSVVHTNMNAYSKPILLIPSHHVAQTMTPHQPQMTTLNNTVTNRINNHNKHTSENKLTEHSDSNLSIVVSDHISPNRHHNNPNKSSPNQSYVNNQSNKTRQFILFHKTALSAVWRKYKQN